jgi:hypothetical protein
LLETYRFPELGTASQELNIDTDFIADYHQFIQQAEIRNPMEIENFLNPIDEYNGIQVEPTDEEIV